MKTFLGIDLDTTNVTAVLTDGHKKLLGVANVTHHADFPAVSGGAEQDVAKIKRSKRCFRENKHDSFNS